MDIETRITNLESLVNSLVELINNRQFYTDADINGVRKNVSDITPYTETKTAYIEDTKVVFENVPSGALLVSFANGNMDYSISRDNGDLKVTFEPLNEVTEITITVQ